MNFQQGLSGLNTTSKSLEVIGNNIANASTYGAKTSRAEFADIYAGALGSAGGTSNIGIGVNLAAVTQQFSQGTISSTENSLDVAINGAGFFQVRDTSGAMLYSRNGQFKVDNEGYIVNSQGQQLQGYQADSQGVVIPRAATALQLPTAGIEPKESTSVTMEVNLDSRATSTTTAVDFNDASTYTKATSQTLYDVKGQAVAMTYYFKKTATDNWDVYATANGTSVNLDASGNPAAVTSVVFPTSGAAPTSPSAPVPISIPAAADGSYEAMTGVTLDLSSATQYGSSFSITNLKQDGYAPGQLSSLQIADNGIITARYTNGTTKAAGQIELANFRNPQGLQALGGNAWAATYASGDPVVGEPTSGTLGALQSGALEESNVDLTGELVNMITAQRIYQANAQTIKTQDAVLQTLVSLR